MTEKLGKLFRARSLVDFRAIPSAFIDSLSATGLVASSQCFKDKL
jgi:hypothetical protein